MMRYFAAVLGVRVGPSRHRGAAPSEGRPAGGAGCRRGVRQGESRHQRDDALPPVRCVSMPSLWSGRPRRSGRFSASQSGSIRWPPVCHVFQTAFALCVPLPLPCVPTDIVLCGHCLGLTFHCTCLAFVLCTHCTCFSPSLGRVFPAFMIRWPRG